MAITTRDYKIETTSTVSNLSGSSIGMPDGMTSSISSDGTTFLLNGDDSQISAAGSGTITMTATGTDDLQNERSASASVPGEIISQSSFSSFTIDMTNLSTQYTSAIGCYLVKIEYDADFRIGAYGYSENGEHHHLDFSSTNLQFGQYFHGGSEGNPNQFSLSVAGQEPIQGEQDNNNPTIGTSDYTDEYGIWTVSNHTYEGNFDFTRPLILTTNSEGAPYDHDHHFTGNIHLTFGKEISSTFALKMN